MSTSAACAIDFGTSNCAVALPSAGSVRLVDLEPGQLTMPTAVFYAVEGVAAHEPPQRMYGRAAVAAYLEGMEGRLMRSLKSLLGSTLFDQHTAVGDHHVVPYHEVVAGCLRRLKTAAEQALGRPIERAVLGRPVYFVDGDPARDAAAQAALAQAARDAGLRELSFQYEPIAAALDHERSVTEEQVVMVADIGGGTSDFSLVRVGPARAQRLERGEDILANHGVHVAGTDFDRQIALHTVLPLAGWRGRGPGGREVPSKVYHDLATWHLIPTVYTAQRVAELARMKGFYADARQHERLMAIVRQRLGHALIGQAEAAKIAVAEGRPGHITLDALEPGLAVMLDAAQAEAALAQALARIVAAAEETLRQAGLPREAVQALYFTGGSTGYPVLAERLAGLFPTAQRIQGDRFASVAQGLGRHALRLYGPNG